MKFGTWDDNTWLYYKSCVVYIILPVNKCPVILITSMRDSNGWPHGPKPKHLTTGTVVLNTTLDILRSLILRMLDF